MPSPNTHDYRRTDRLAYSVGEFSRTFSVGRSTVFAEIAAGRLRARKIGARTLIAHDDALAWLNSLPPRQGTPDSRPRDAHG